MMQGKTVQYVSTTKFLGVIIDNKIKWNDHIIYIKNEISKSIGIIYKMRQYLDRTTLKKNYTTHLSSHISFIVVRYGVIQNVHIQIL